MKQSPPHKPCPTVFDIRRCDCITGMGLLQEGSVDLVVTSPPYNLGIRYSTYRDNDRRDAFLSWCMEWGRAIHRALGNDGSLFLNIAGPAANPMLPHEIVCAFTNGLFRLQNTIHWVKSITIDETGDAPVISRGHFKPINSPRFLNGSHEYIFHFTKSGRVALDRLAVGVPYADKSNIARWGHTSGRDRRCRGNVWFIPYQTIRNRQSERPHPATFPPQLAENCILLHGGVETMTMLDPFLGIGNSAIAAQALGVKQFIGFDIDEEYLRTARQRIQRQSHDTTTVCQTTVDPR